MAINTIIFGPTGGVASYAIQYASEHGAQVTLAMRDPSKPIKTLTAEQEKSGSFTRVKADLTDPASVLAAAKDTNAHSAFIYLIHGPQGTPRASIQALKDAGVKHLVFLSSYSIDGPVRSLTKRDWIPYAHAQVEIDLEEVYGEGNFTAARPASFASNILRSTGQFPSGVCRELSPDNAFDFITPRDIGDVCGALLLKQDSLPRIVDIVGPQVLSQRDALTMCAKAVNRDIEIVEMSREEGVQEYITKNGLPENIAVYLARVMTEDRSTNAARWEEDRFKVAQGAVKEWTGHDAMKFDQWVEENKAAFA